MEIVTALFPAFIGRLFSKRTRNYIASFLDEGMSFDQAAERRARLMEERKSHAVEIGTLSDSILEAREERKQERLEAEFNLCEH